VVLELMRSKLSLRKSMEERNGKEEPSSVQLRGGKNNDDRYKERCDVMGTEGTTTSIDSKAFDQCWVLLRHFGCKSAAC
jgi:hypothetical protein